MQNFIDKVSESKGKLLVGLGGAALVGLFGYLYRQYNNQENEQIVSQQQKIPEEPFDLKKQMAKFKQTVNLENPSFEEVKLIIAFSFDMTFKEIQRIHKDFKVSRRLVKKQGNLKQYFKTVGAGMIRLRQIGATLQQAILIQLGVNPEFFAPYQNELSDFIQEQQTKRTLGSEKASLGEIKQMINLQINLLKERGNQLVSNIVEHCKNWQVQAKKYIPDVFTVYMTDELAQKHPEIDNYDMRGTEKRFEKYLVAQGLMMKQQMQPLIARLISQLGMYQNAPQQE